MAYVVVLLVAIVAGCAVGVMTLRAGRVAPGSPETWTESYRDGSTGESGRETATARRSLPPDPNAQTRVIGAAGLAGAVLIGAGAIAFLASMVWALLKGLFS